MIGFFYFFSSPSSQAAARTPRGGLWGGPGPACGLLPPLPAQPRRICRQRRGEKKRGGKVIGNETRGNEFSLVVTPGSRGKLGSGKEAPTPKKSRPRRPTRPQPHPHPKSFSSPLSFPAAPAHSVSVGQTSWERAPQTRLQHPSHSISASPTYSIHPRRT